MNHDANDTAGQKLSTSKHRGGCHCGAVRFEATVDLAKGASRCNCSICLKLGTSGAIIKPEAFTLLAGNDQLSRYGWGAKISQRYFCKNCGVHCFGHGYLDMLGGEFVSVNLNCLDEVDVNQLPMIYWDGRHDNWQAGPRPSPWPVFADTAATAAA
jgi:hypothetical protein